MTIAGLSNLAAMMATRGSVHLAAAGIADLDRAYLTLEPLLSHAATVFGLDGSGRTFLHCGRDSGRAGGV